MNCLKEKWSEKERMKHRKHRRRRRKTSLLLRLISAIIIPILIVCRALMTTEQSREDLNAGQRRRRQIIKKRILKQLLNIKSAHPTIFTFFPRLRHKWRLESDAFYELERRRSQCGLYIICCSCNK